MLIRLPLPQCFCPRGRKLRPWSEKNSDQNSDHPRLCIYWGKEKTQTMVWVSGEGKLRPWSEFRAFLVRSHPGKPNQRKASSWTFRRGIPEWKFNLNRACFPKEKHQNSQKRAKFMNFSFCPFLWFGLPRRLLIWGRGRRGGSQEWLRSDFPKRLKSHFLGSLLSHWGGVPRKSLLSHFKTVTSLNKEARLLKFHFS